MIRQPPRSTPFPYPPLFRSEGSTVKLRVSASSKLPDLAGQPVDAAEETLRNLGLRPEIRRQWSSAVPAGRVIATSPPAGRQVREDRKSTRLNSSHANISYAV